MISVIMPTYNEAGNIGELIERTVKTLKQNYEIIVVDDNSPDGTCDLVRKLQKNFPKVRLVTRQYEHGLPGAIMRGIKEAKGEILAWFDCDLTMPPEKLPEMIKLLDENDIVIGSRFIEGGQDQRGENFTKTMSLILNYLSLLFFGSDVHDYTSGFIVAKKSAVSDMVFSGRHGTYFINLLVEAKSKGRKIAEIPYILTPRFSGKSKIRHPLDFIQASLIYLQIIFSLKLKLLRAKLLE
jgi:dolichol-phosphate mannosyltransferase